MTAASSLYPPLSQRPAPQRHVWFLDRCAQLCLAAGRQDNSLNHFCQPLQRQGGLGMQRLQPGCRRSISVAAPAARAASQTKCGKQRRGAPEQHGGSSEEPLKPRPLRVGEMLELKCDSLAFGGQGVCRLVGDAHALELAHLQDFVVLTRGAIPGERVTARVQRVAKGYAVAGKVATLRDSPDAAVPPCPHFGPCGGCQLQGLQYSAQLAAKQAQVSDMLQRIAGVADICSRTLPIVGAAQRYRYRNKMEFTFSGQTWVPADDGLNGASVPMPALGFGRTDHADQVLPIDACWLQDAVANGILDAVRDGVAAARLQPLGKQGPKGSQSGLLQRVAIRRGACPETGAPQHMVHLVTATEPAAAAMLAPVVDTLRERCPSVVSVVRSDAAAAAAAAAGPQRRRRGKGPRRPLPSSEVLWGQPTISQELGGLRFDISAASFFQTNSAQAAVLTAMIAAAADVQPTDVVLDLFCGAGFFALALARRCSSVFGFEVSATAVADARSNAAANGIGNARFGKADLDEGLPGACDAKAVPPPDVVVADPGRAGMSRKLLGWLSGCSARKIVYVSCNPATQARDLAFLLGTAADAPHPPRYQLQVVQACDLFPQTSHVESMAVLTLRQEVPAQ